MGKRKKRLTMAKYATKYAKKREAMARRRGVIEIDISTGEEATTEDIVEVVANTTTSPEEENNNIPTPEPQLQTVQVEEPKVNALKQTSKPKKKATTRKKATTSRRKRATKTTTSAD